MQNDAQEKPQLLGLSGKQQVFALALLAAIAVLTAIYFGLGRQGTGASQAAMPSLITSDSNADAFRPTPSQLASLQFERVGRRIFHTEIVTEGYVAPNGGLAAAGPAGGPVAKGYPMLAGQSSDVLQSESDLATASAQFRLAQANEARQRALFESEGAAQKDWQQSQFDLASAGAALASARNRLRILGKTDVEIAALEKSPPAAKTANGAPSAVFSVGDQSSVWLVANVREADAGLVHPGDQVDVQVPAYPQQTFHAVLTYVASVIDPATHRLVVGAEIRNSDNKLKPNMLATFTITAGPGTDAPAVPLSSIVYDGSESRVWVADGQGHLNLRRVSVGRTSSGYAEITNGLSGGERVVTAGALFIDRAGQGD
jgi:cobalt-zinc-cadmium efflux system membrane fusion protein